MPSDMAADLDGSVAAGGFVSDALTLGVSDVEPGWSAPACWVLD